jgi:hypothetical protein
MGGSRSSSYTPPAPVAAPAAAPRIEDVTATEDEYMKSREEMRKRLRGAINTQASILEQMAAPTQAKTKLGQ